MDQKHPTAERRQATSTWADLVLPEETTRQLHEIADEARREPTERAAGPGLATAVLFEGSRGAGMALAAEVIANDLGLDLYRIDLSAVVSKYIGETEKNLRRIFDEAERGGVLLFFDEADALFGKRTEVRDSHDRYANQEVDGLLERIEGFEGLVILASNQKEAIDSAFLRRLRYVVAFPEARPAGHRPPIPRPSV